jgi:uncharacterized protein
MIEALPLVWVVVGVLLIVGLVGTVLPYVPGSPLILVAVFIYAFATDFKIIGFPRLVFFVAITILSSVLAYAGSAIGTKRAGGSAWAVVGALVGGLIGLFFAPPGLFVGPVVGAIAAEWIRTGRFRGSVRSGAGALMGMVAGAVLHFAFAVVMVGLFLFWVWRGW